MHLKRFLEWIGLKERLDAIIHKAPYVSEDEIWWASIGENVGTEISGKHRLFSRPVIIFKKLSHSFYSVIPVTSQIRNGNRRLSNKIGELDGSDFEKIKIGFRKLYH